MITELGIAFPGASATPHLSQNDTSMAPLHTGVFGRMWSVDKSDIDICSLHIISLRCFDYLSILISQTFIMGGAKIEAFLDCGMSRDSIFARLF